MAGDVCEMSLYGPSVEQWQYLYVESIAEEKETISFKVVVHTVGECWLFTLMAPLIGLEDFKKYYFRDYIYVILTIGELTG